jgi:hypothetical protein
MHVVWQSPQKSDPVAELIYGRRDLCPTGALPRRRYYGILQ